MKLALVKGATSQTVYIFIQNSSVTTGAGLASLVYNSSGLTCYYVRPLAAAVQVTLATQTVTGAYSSGGFVAVDNTNMPGVYRLDLPDAVLASGVNSVVVNLRGATNMAPVNLEIQLTSVNLNDAVRAGMTALPNAAANAAGGLPISAAGALAMDGLATTANQTTLLNRLGAITGTGVNTVLGFFQALLKSDASNPSDIGGTYDAATDSLEAIRNTAPLGTAMRGTDSAALASVCTEARLAELDAANLPADLDAVKADTASLDDTKIPNVLSLANINAEVDTALTDYDAVVPGDLPTNFADLAITVTTGQVTVGTNNDKTGYAISGTKTTLDALNDISPAEVNAEADTALTDYDPPTRAELTTDINTVLAQLPADAPIEGTADSGSTTTLVDAARTEADTDYWKGSFVLFTSGTLNGQARLITGFTPASDTITFTPATTQAVSTHTYRIIPAARIEEVLVLTGHTAQTGDSFARIGAPAGADLAADVAAVKSDSAAILTDTADMQPKLGTPAGADMSADIAAIKAETALIVADTNELQTDDVPGLIAALNDPTTTAIADAVWDEAIAGHLTAGSTGEALNNATAPTAAAVADAVWDEPIADHLGAGSTGESLNAAGGAGDPWITTLPGSYTGSQAGKMLSDVLTDTADMQPKLGTPAGADMSADIAAVKAETNSLDGTKIPDTISLVAINAEVDTALTDYDPPTRAELTTDINTVLAQLPADAPIEGTADSGSTTTLVDAARTEADTDYWKGSFLLFTSGTLSGQTRLITGFTPASDTITFTPATTQAVSTHTYRIIPAARIEEVLVLTGHTAQTGDSFARIGTPAGADLAADVAAVKTDSAAILTDTADMQPKLGTPAADLSADVAAIKAETALIVADTNELQTDDVPGLIAALNNISTAQVNAEVDTALADIGLDHLVAAAVVGTDITDNSIIAKIAAKGVTADWDTFDNTTESLEAIRDTEPLGTAMRGTDSAVLATTVGTPAGADLSADIAAVKSDSAAILTDTADMQPKLGTPAADLSADIAAVKSDTAATLTDTADMQPKLGTPAGASISVDIAAIKAETNSLDGTKIPDVISLAAINAEVVDTLATDTYAQPGQETPAATTSLSYMLRLLYKMARNKKDQTGSENRFYNDDGTTVDQKQTTTDAGGVTTKGEITTGP